MKKLLSIIGANGLGTSAPAPLIANTTTVKQSEEKTTDIITIDGIEYQKEKINISNVNGETIAVDSNDNVYFGTDNGAYILKPNSINPVKIQNINVKVIALITDKPIAKNIYIQTQNGNLYKLSAGSDTAELSDESPEGLSGRNILDSKGNLYKIID